MPERIRIAITCGEPSGIGAEVVIKALEALSDKEAEFLLVGPRLVWSRAKAIISGDNIISQRVLETPSPAPEWSWGVESIETSKVAAEAVELGAKLALAGDVDALVTAPLTKSGLASSGRNFPGHTELLGAICGGVPTMYFAGGKLIVALATTHLPLSMVAQSLTMDSLSGTLERFNEALAGDLGIDSPRIGLCALNPHGGEGGLLGIEEEKIIKPVAAKARSAGVDVIGPLPADTLFHQASLGAYDGVIAMYHDQGLAPFKMLHFHDGVNITAGLKIVRTSPDHGTAPDIAGRGIAREDSMLAAIKYAIRIAKVRNKRQR
ncbi:MAG: 4-hydroxythreonine-4-phosphate dehydrogenase PdxA [Deltaproteobacteria bacterium]|nr:MAG: 4-hydroxythreonine-4-phosphate dehydrogenase PdxA [Deltaproteobacteria bacterium]